MANTRPTDAFMKRLMAMVQEDNLEGDPEHVPQLTLAQRRFLEAYKNVGTVSGACRESNCNSKSHYNWCARSSTYRVAFIRAEMEARDEILEICRKVAIDEKNVPMLIHLSKGIFPELFGTQRHELSGPDGQAINLKSTSSVDQILGRIDDIVRKRQEALDPQPEESRLLEGPQDELEHSEA